MVFIFTISTNQVFAQAIAIPSASVEKEGYGRLLLNFAPSKSAPTYSTEQFNGIFVVSFDEAIELDTSQIIRRLRRYTSIIRLSDDRRSIRFGLSRGVQINVTPAAERLYIDFLPENWVGDLPILPQDVIVELARRAELALKENRLSKARLRDDFTNPELRIAVGRHASFTRLELQWNIEFRSKIEKSENQIDFVFDVVDQVDLAALKADLPALVRTINSDNNEKETRISVGLQDGVEVRTYREENTIVVDLTTKALQEETEQAYLAKLAGEKPVSAFDSDLDTQSAQLRQPLTVKPATEPSTPNKLSERSGADSGAILSADPDPLQLPRPEKLEGLEGSSVASQDANNDIVVVRANRGDSTTEFLFPFKKDVSAAVFQRANSLWLVFDDASEFDLRAIDQALKHDLRHKSVFRLGNYSTAIRLVFNHAGVVGAFKRENQWSVTFGSKVHSSSQPIALERGIDERGRAVMRAKFAAAGKVHKFIDPGVGDELIVVTGFGPMRGISRRQSFVEFRTLPSKHGLAFVPLADGLNAFVEQKNVIVSREGLGLRLSDKENSDFSISLGVGPRSGSAPGSFANSVVGSVKSFHKQLANLENDLSSADKVSAKQRRKDLIRFFLANERASEALGHLNRYAQLYKMAETDADWKILKGAALTLSGRYSEALKTLQSPQINQLSEASFWATIAAANLHDWDTAAKAANSGQRAIASYPEQIQKQFHLASAEASINVNNHASASESLSIIAGGQTTAAERAKYFLLRSKLADDAGQRGDAIRALEFAMRTGYKPGIVAAKFELARLDSRDNAVPKDELIGRLESLSASWRGDEIELLAQRNLGRIYVQNADYRKAFGALNSVLSIASDSEIARSMFDEMQDVFAGLFSQSTDKKLTPLKSVGLFYDFRNLLPAGRRGDELVRKLANRLIDLDLLDKAVEVLVHQIDHRLQGAAKAQIASDAAAVYMMNHKPHLALNLLRRTQQARLPAKLNRQRRVLESVALAQVGRLELALELLSSLDGPDIDRVRGDLYWDNENYADAAALYERVLGHRWATTQSLSNAERMYVMRAAIGHSLNNNNVALEELRSKFGELMANSPDANAFDILAQPSFERGAKFDSVAQTVKSIRALGGFIEDYRKNYLQTPIPDKIAVEDELKKEQQANLSNQNIKENTG